MPRIALVTYATWAGSTTEIAESVAKTLHDPSLDVDVKPAREVHSLSGYDAVILGTPIQMSRPHPDARRFVRRFRNEFNNMQVAFLWHA